MQFLGGVDPKMIHCHNRDSNAAYNNKEKQACITQTFKSLRQKIMIEKDQNISVNVLRYTYEISKIRHEDIKWVKQNGR